MGTGGQGLIDGPRSWQKSSQGCRWGGGRLAHHLPAPCIIAFTQPPTTNNTNRTPPPQKLELTHCSNVRNRPRTSACLPSCPTATQAPPTTANRTPPPQKLELTHCSNVRNRDLYVLAKAGLQLKCLTLGDDAHKPWVTNKGLIRCAGAARAAHLGRRLR